LARNATQKAREKTTLSSDAKKEQEPQWRFTAMSDLLVLTRVIDASDPYWDHNATIIGTLQQISAIVDLSNGVPFGWRLLRGKKARRFLRWATKHEMRWQREQAAQKAAGGVN
jgi:hypothetical protein